MENIRHVFVAFHLAHSCKLSSVSSSSELMYIRGRVWRGPLVPRNLVVQHSLCLDRVVEYGGRGVYVLLRTCVVGGVAFCLILLCMYVCAGQTARGRKYDDASVFGAPVWRHPEVLTRSRITWIMHRSFVSISFLKVNARGRFTLPQSGGCSCKDCSCCAALANREHGFSFIKFTI